MHELLHIIGFCPESLAHPNFLNIFIVNYQEILNLTTAMQTFTAPAGSKWALVNTDETNTANVRVKFGGSATATSGIQFQPGRSETFNLSGNITVFAESGASQKVYVQFGNT